MLIWPFIIGESIKLKSGYQLLAEGNQHNTHISTNCEWIWKNLWRLNHSDILVFCRKF